VVRNHVGNSRVRVLLLSTLLLEQKQIVPGTLDLLLADLLPRPRRLLSGRLHAAFLSQLRRLKSVLDSQA
jgi:hypothetical protein